MTATWSLVITTVGAIATTLLGVIVGGRVSSRAQIRYWTRDREMEACALLLRESSNILIELAAMNGPRVTPRAGEVRLVPDCQARSTGGRGTRRWPCVTQPSEGATRMTTPLSPASAVPALGPVRWIVSGTTTAPASPPHGP